MDNTTSHICIYSYNSRGSNENKLEFIKDIIEIPQRNIPIFCLQEHFLLRNNVYKLSKAFKNYAVLAKPAYKNFKVQDKGRPMGGLATIIPKGWRKNTTILKSQSWRIQPLLIKVNMKSFLVLNSYFPTDPRTMGGENIELENVLAELSTIISSTNFDSLYLVGDLNCNFLRNSSHVECVKTFMNDCNMYSLWRDFPVDFTHVFENENRCFSNTIDHILTLSRSSDEVVDAGVLHLVENMSDHEPIYVVIKVKQEPAEVDEIPRVEAKPKPIWKKASPDQKLEFNDILFRKLSSMNIPEELTKCSNVHCDDASHKKAIDSYIEELLANVNESGFETLPISKPSVNKRKEDTIKSTAGWKDYVEPFQDKARFWFAVWKSAGKPMNTELHKVMKMTKNRYHYQVRKCQRIENFIKNRKIVENCLDTDTDLFAEIKRQRANFNEDDVTIDGSSGRDIPNKFADVYKELFNRCNDEEKIKDMKNDIEGRIDQSDLREIDKINSTVIKEALDKIKSNKSDPLFDFSSDFLKNAPELLHEHLAIVIKAFVTHAHVTANLLIATLVPIVKDKLADLCDSKNYRSIAISSLILKLLDWIILLNYGHLLRNNDSQFGFQKHSNTSLCSWMVYETIDQYLRNGSTVYGCLLDCTKAFDTVEHSKLFQKLLDSNVPPIIVRLLICIYRNQTANVRWKDGISDEFFIKNGVRQGAVISPIFFSFYMDNLFDLLKNSGSGCVLSNYYSGCFGYADDLFFVCPSRGGLQEMLDIAQKYVQEHNIGFSTHPEPAKSKTKGIIFSRKPLKFAPTPLRLNGDPLPWVEKAKYLGNTVNNIPDGLCSDVKQKRAAYIERNVELNLEFPSAHPEVKCRINRIYNTSYPGSVLYDMTSDSVNQLVNSWSVSVRHMWGLPMQAHRYLIEQLAGEHAQAMILSRYVKFLQNVQKSPKLAAQFMLQKVYKNVNTITGRNIRYIQDKVGHNHDLLKVNTSWLKNKIKFCEIDEGDKWRVGLIKEVVDIKQNKLEIKPNDEDSFLSRDQLQDIIDFVSTS